MRVSRRMAAVYVILASAAFSTSGPLARYARPAHPLFIAFGRVALASLILFAIAPRQVIESLQRLSWPQRFTILLAGFILAIHFALFLWGLDTTSLPAALALISLEPLSVILCAWVAFRLRPTRLEQLGVLLATVGGVVISQGAGHGEHRLLGDVMVLGAVMLFGVYVVLTRALRDALPAQSYAVLVYGSAAVTLAIGLFAIPGIPQTLPPQHSLLAIVLLALIPTIVGHTSVQIASRYLSPALVSLVCPGETLGGILLGALWLAAVPTAIEVIGGLVILTGTTLAILGSNKD